MNIKSNQFLKQHFQELLDAGIELKTLEEKDGWSYLMAHSDCFYTMWNLKELTYNQLVKLEKIVSNYVSISSCDENLLKSLRYRLELLERQLLKLNYSKNWLETGILDIFKLEEQIVQFQKEKDLNTEHYRYAIFKDNIKNIDKFNDSQINNLVEIISQDNDRTMAGSALVELLRKENLTEEQFNSVKNVLIDFGQWTIKVIERQTKKRIKLATTKPKLH